MTRSLWRCEAHNVVIDGDCPRCDDELIALIEESALPPAARLTPPDSEQAR